MNAQELEFGNEFEFANEFGQEYGHETGYELGQEFEYGHEMGHEMHEIGQNQELHESLEMELAHELLNVTNEQELNLFLGKLVRGIGRGVRNFARSSVGKAIGGALKKVAKVALPIAGKALGGMVGGPLGAMVGSKLGSAASNLFELELEGLSPEDREFEIARAYVRFANDAIQNAAREVQSNPNPNPVSVANRAIQQSAQELAPGLLSRIPKHGPSRARLLSLKYPIKPTPNSADGTTSEGRWVRRGNQITLFL